MAGLWFEELQVGTIHRHPITRTATETDNILISALTHNPQRGIVEFRYQAFKQCGELVASCLRQAMINFRPAATS